ncbi:hypothetical protein CNMCM5793_008478 [Aspergillus hiratsukae]|uniref:Major facilitator superfamily (MFS) profile domain-containing protein n=1 Tax=Aspergillus hiratsukae TaxID=1194566 RepID=A0A8H6P731_9EURO|nr:hypothetical protein CNMCM5793_008478 [Aspergillus hiratsukae]
MVEKALRYDDGSSTPDSGPVVDSLSEDEREIEPKLRRKLDLRIMPVVVLIYLLNFIDRSNYTAARLQGLERDLHLSSSEYQVGLSVFFVGYVLGPIPSNLLLNYLGRPSSYIGLFGISWGLVTLLTSQVKSYGSIAACRFILGVVEAPLFPGIMFYLSKWYTQRELSVRITIFFSASHVANAFGSLMAAGILNGLDGHRGLSAWQWLYIIEGTISIFAGFIAWSLLPDFPENWRALSPEMKHVAIRRMALQAAESDLDEDNGTAASQLTGLKLAFTDPKLYLFSAIYICIVGSFGFTNFFPTLTSSLGYNHTISLLLAAPPFLFMTLYSIIHSLLSDRLQSRFWFFIYPIPIAITGFILFMNTNTDSDSLGIKYASTFLMMFAVAMNGTTLSWAASSMPRPPAKRAVAYALMNSLGNTTGIWTPFTYRDADWPRYRLALGICVGLQAGAAVLGTWLRVLLGRENKRLERVEREGVQGLRGGNGTASGVTGFRCIV